MLDKTLITFKGFMKISKEWTYINTNTWIKYNYLANF